MVKGSVVSTLRVLSFWAGVFVLGLLGCVWLLFVGGVVLNGTVGAAAIFWGLFEISVVVGLVGFLLVKLGLKK